MELKMRQKLAVSSLSDGETGNTVLESDLKKINGMKQNGPINPLTAEQIFVRRMIILGTEPTSKLSIHPEGILNGKKINTLSELAKQLPGTPMMEGHRVDKAAWGRIFDAEVVNELKGYSGPVLKISYYFLKADNGEKRAARIDGGIDAEGSISYWHGEVCCSLCHTPLMVGSFFGITLTRSRCKHELGKSYDNQIAYWYPTKLRPAEVSSVYRGAYPKTKSILTMEKLPKTEEELCAAYNDAEDQTERMELALADAIIAEAMPKEENTTTQNQEETNGENQNSDTNTRTNKTGNQPEPNVNGTGNPEHTGNTPIKPGNIPVGNLNENQPEINNSRINATPTIENTTPSENNTTESRNNATTQKGKYLACLNCNYWEDFDKNKPKENPVCPKCNSNMQQTNEKPPVKKKHEYQVCLNCGYSVTTEIATELTLTECVECGTTLTENKTALPENYAEEMTKTENKIGTLVGPIKPEKSGATNNEFFTLENFKNLEGKYMVEPKYDGVYIEAHKKSGKVTLLTDGNNHQEEKFPNVVAEIEKMDADNFVLMGEIVKYRGRQRGTHSDVTAYMASKGPYEDYHFRYKPFDMAYADGKDIRELTKDERRNIQDREIKSTAHVHPTKYNVVSGGPKLVRAIEAMATREGAMIKNMEMTLNAAGRKDIYKWKRQSEVDARVSSVSEKKTGLYVYECEVGSGAEVQRIGQTYVTKVKAEKGDIIRVLVDRVTLDEATGKYSWYAPKVDSVRNDKTEPDPVSTLKKIAEKKNAPPRSKNGMLLSDVLPLLEQHAHEYDLFVCGGLVSNGSSQHDIDILTTRELSAVEKGDILDVLGEDYGPYVDFIVNEKGPESTHVKLASKMPEELSAGAKYAKRFVLQEHKWGSKVHYDLRFGNPDGTKMWGWTLFKAMPLTEKDAKVRCQEKEYHDVKWMDFDGEIKPGQPGNPTKNLTAYMTILDKGKYDFIKRKPKFLEVVLHGKKYSGRYVFRQIEVVAKKNEMCEQYAGGDEAKPKSDKIWIMWKPVNQTAGIAVNKIEYAFNGGVLYYWEGSDIDPESEV